MNVDTWLLPFRGSDLIGNIQVLLLRKKRKKERETEKKEKETYFSRCLFNYLFVVLSFLGLLHMLWVWP